jgi:hypothetical protein
MLRLLDRGKLVSKTNDAPPRLTCGLTPIALSQSNITALCSLNAPIPASTRWYVYAAVALNDIPAKRIYTIDTEDQLWPSKGIGALVRNI